MAYIDSGTGFDVQHGFPGYRVFIFGKEVTEDVISMSVQFGAGEQPSVISITLVSPEDKYIITHRDVVKANPELATIPIVDDTIIRGINSSSTGSPDSDVRDVKWHPYYGVLSVKSGTDFGTLPDKAERYVSGGTDTSSRRIRRYPLQVGRPIFHPMDPVRIVWQDPFNPTDWYWMFSGFISDFTDDLGVNQDGIVTIVAETPAKIMRYGRFTANSGFVDVNKLQIVDAIIADVAVKTAYTSPFVDSTLPEIFYAMIFGINSFGSDNIKTFKNQYNDVAPDMINEKLVSANGIADVGRRRWGCGHPSLDGSRVCFFGPKDSGAKNINIPAALNNATNTIYDITLEQYQSILDNKVQASDLKTMRNATAKSEFISTIDNLTSPSIDDVITIIGEHPEIFNVDGGRLIMLLPSSMGSNQREIIDKDIPGTSFALNTEWATRADILNQITKRIEFVFYVSPRGDWVVEFPLYDFMPSDFGKYENNFTVELKDTSGCGSTFSDAKVYTQAVTTAVVLNRDADIGISQNVGRQGIVTLWDMIPMFGVRHAPVTNRGYVRTPEAAKMYSAIVLNRLNADAVSFKVNANPRVAAWVNRPHKIKARDTVATSKNVVHTISWGASGSIDTNIDFYAVRGWDGKIDSNNNKIYTPIAGKTSTPLDYEILLGKSR